MLNLPGLAIPAGGGSGGGSGGGLLAFNYINGNHNPGLSTDMAYILMGIVYPDLALTAPASGNVFVSLSGTCYVDGAYNANFGLYDPNDSDTQYGDCVGMLQGNAGLTTDTICAFDLSFYISGLTPDTSYTWRLAGCGDSGSNVITADADHQKLTYGSQSRTQANPLILAAFAAPA